jgi:hypothetical protein
MEERARRDDHKKDQLRQGLVEVVEDSGCASPCWEGY